MTGTKIHSFLHYLFHTCTSVKVTKKNDREKIELKTVKVYIIICGENVFFLHYMISFLYSLIEWVRCEAHPLSNYKTSKLLVLLCSVFYIKVLVF